VINVRTAELIGLKVPTELFARADRTID